MKKQESKQPEVKESDHSLEQWMQWYPSIERAAPIVLKSFDWMLQRYESGQQSLSTVINWATALTAALLTVGIQSKRTLDSEFFWIALLLFAIGVGVSIYARAWSGIKLLDPNIIHKETSQKQAWFFDNAIVGSAAESFIHNAHVIKTKWQLLMAAQILFVIEMLILVLWVSGI